MTSHAPLRTRVEMQGFLGLSDDTLVELEPWLRFSPAVCAAWAASATWVGSVPSLIALSVLALLGAALPRHPFDLLYNLGIRRLTSTPVIPRYAAPRRFACLVGSAWLASTAAAFALGAPGTARVLGSFFTALALVPVLTGFCVPSFVFSRWVRRS